MSYALKTVIDIHRQCCGPETGLYEGRAKNRYSSCIQASDRLAVPLTRGKGVQIVQIWVTVRMNGAVGHFIASYLECLADFSIDPEFYSCIGNCQ